LEKTKNKIAIRVDGGQLWSISMGHVYRSLTLASELKKNPLLEIQFVMRDFAEGVRVVCDREFPIILLDPTIDIPRETEILGGLKANLMIFDGIDVEKKPLEFFAQQKIKTLAIDDLGGKSIAADVVVNGSIVPENHHYSHGQHKTQYYLGEKYAVIDPSFSAKNLRKRKAHSFSVLLFFGGSDPAGLTIQVIKILERYPDLGEIKVVLGSSFGDATSVRSLIQNAVHPYTILQNVSNLAEIMGESDLAITSGGQVAYEAAACGLPLIIIPSIEHERKTAAAFCQKGMAVSIENLHASNEQKLLELFDGLKRDLKKRQAMSNISVNTIDGLGCGRVANIILELLNS
jgi:spore coat polysaccharide biosynthesis predicted glycosyltransferase SpsG